METGISKAAQGSPSMQRSEQLSLSTKKKQIVAMLAMLSIRRRSRLEAEDYSVLASDLMDRDLRDLEAGLTALGRTPSEDHKPMFPDLGTMLAAVMVAQGERMEAERAAANAAEQEAKRRHRLEHPEEYPDLCDKGGRA